MIRLVFYLCLMLLISSCAWFTSKPPEEESRVTDAKTITPGLRQEDGVGSS